MDNETVQACLHLYSHLTQYICRKKKYFVFKTQKLLAPVWWRLVVWTSFLVATMSVLLSLCFGVLCFCTLWIAQKLAQSNFHFLILLTVEGNPGFLVWPIGVFLGEQPFAGLRGCCCPCWSWYLGCFTIVGLVCPSPWPWLPWKEPLSKSI